MLGLGLGYLRIRVRVTYQTGECGRVALDSRFDCRLPLEMTKPAEGIATRTNGL